MLTEGSLSGHGIYFPDLKQLHFSSEETYLFPLQATGPLCNLLRQRSITRVILFALTILLSLLEDTKRLGNPAATSMSLHHLLQEGGPIMACADPKADLNSPQLKLVFPLTPFASVIQHSLLQQPQQRQGGCRGAYGSSDICCCQSWPKFPNVYTGTWLRKSVKFFEYSTFSSHVNGQIKTQDHLYVITLTHRHKVTNLVELPTKHRKQVCSGSVSGCLRLNQFWF